MFLFLVQYFGENYMFFIFGFWLRTFETICFFKWKVRLNAHFLSIVYYIFFID